MNEAPRRRLAIERFVHFLTLVAAKCFKLLLMRPLFANMLAGSHIKPLRKQPSRHSQLKTQCKYVFGFQEREKFKFYTKRRGVKNV
jgi:hypothetical protein